MSFQRAESFNLDKIQFPNLSYYGLCFWFQIRDVFALASIKIFLHVFFLKFQTFLFRYRTHFQLHGVRYGSKLITVPKTTQWLWHHLLKTLSFLHWIGCVLLKNISCPYMWVYFQAAYSVPLIYFDANTMPY